VQIDDTYLGTFDTAEEAALAYARAKDAAAPEEVDLEVAAAEALRQAAAKGLTLERSVTAAGFRGVKPNGRGFRVEISSGNAGHKNLGTLDTAEEAALAYARARGPQEEQPEPLTAAEAARQARRQRG
jgi:hypothetical protein